MSSFEEAIEAYYEAKKTYTKILDEAFENRAAQEKLSQYGHPTRDSKETKQPAQEEQDLHQSSMADETRLIAMELEAARLGKGKEKEEPVGKK